MIRLRGNKLHKGQTRIIKEILYGDSMFYTLSVGRQWGKSTLGKQLLLYYAINNPGYQLMWCSPTYSQCNKIFKEIVRGLRGTGVIERRNLSENSIILKNGSEIYFKSITNPDNLRGYPIDIMICDEAAMYPDDVFNAVLRPMLNVRGKKCILLSTPKGKNYFYDMYNLAKENDRYCALSGDYSENPFINLHEIEDARLTLPDLIYKQEYLAEFIDDGGEVFTEIHNHTFDSYPTDFNRRCYAGIDVGRQGDFTVLTIVDHNGNVLYINRWNHDGWENIADNVSIHLQRYNPILTLVEVNGIGDVFYDIIRKKCPKCTFRPFVTSSSSKQNIIENLIYAFQTSSIRIPSARLFKPLIDELENFSFKYSPSSRTIQYGARGSLHDDTVMSLAISFWARKLGSDSGIAVI